MQSVAQSPNPIRQSPANAEDQRVLKESRRIDAEADVWRQEGTIGAGRMICVRVGKGGDRDELRLIQPGSGQSFKDIDDGPEMVVVPAGEFMMGATEEEIADVMGLNGKDFKYESPRHSVVIPKPFAIARRPVTCAQWDVYVTQSGGPLLRFLTWHKSQDRGAERNQKEVVRVSWEDAQRYTQWLRNSTGKEYRLLSEAEWEYAARAARWMPYSFGYGEPSSGENCWHSPNASTKPHPIDENPLNDWGLCDMHANFWEWVEDEWHDSYAVKPDALKSNGGAWTTGRSGAHVLRGGSWSGVPPSMRSAFRDWLAAELSDDYGGFRVARTL
jgi:formylglycine-generating enzyme required for sulfatase activity